MLARVNDIISPADHQLTTQPSLQLNPPKPALDHRLDGSAPSVRTQARQNLGRRFGDVWRGSAGSAEPR